MPLHITCRRKWNTFLRCCIPSSGRQRQWVRMQTRRYISENISRKPVRLGLIAFNPSEACSTNSSTAPDGCDDFRADRNETTEPVDYLTRCFRRQRWKVDRDLNLGMTLIKGGFSSFERGSENGAAESR